MGEYIGRYTPSSTEDFTATSSCTSYSDPFQDKGGRISGSTSRIMDNYSSVHACTLQNFIDFHLKMSDNKEKIRVAPISTKNIMKNSRHSSVDNDYCASADMRRQGVTSRDKNIP